MANELRSALDQFTSQARNHNTKPRKFVRIFFNKFIHLFIVYNIFIFILLNLKIGGNYTK